MAGPRHDEHRGAGQPPHPCPVRRHPSHAMAHPWPCVILLPPHLLVCLRHHHHHRRSDHHHRRSDRHRRRSYHHHRRSDHHHCRGWDLPQLQGHSTLDCRHACTQPRGEKTLSKDPMTMNAKHTSTHTYRMHTHMHTHAHMHTQAHIHVFYKHACQPSSMSPPTCARRPGCAHCWAKDPRWPNHLAAGRGLHPRRRARHWGSHPLAFLGSYPSQTAESTQSVGGGGVGGRMRMRCWGERVRTQPTCARLNTPAYKHHVHDSTTPSTRQFACAGDRGKIL